MLSERTPGALERFNRRRAGPPIEVHRLIGPLLHPGRPTDIITAGGRRGEMDAVRATRQSRRDHTVGKTNPDLEDERQLMR